MKKEGNTLYVPIYDNVLVSYCKTQKILAAKLDTDKMKAPSFMMVLTGTGQYAMR